MNIGSAKSVSQRAIFVSIFFFFDRFGRSSIISPRNISCPTIAKLNYRYKPPAILKAMTLGTSINGTTSLSGYSLFPWEINFKFVYKSA